MSIHSSLICSAIQTATVYLKMGCTRIEKDASGFLRLVHPTLRHRVYVFPCIEFDRLGVVLYHAIRWLSRRGYSVIAVVARDAWNFVKGWWRVKCLVSFVATQ